MKRKIVIIILLVLIIISIQNKRNNKLINKICGISMLEITSGSMDPVIKQGEIVIIKETKDYKVGDIITYRVDEKFLITHRIVEINLNNVITKGDYNNTNDEPIKIEAIEGKVILHSMLLGYIYKFKIIILIVLSILFFIF